MRSLLGTAETTMRVGVHPPPPCYCSPMCGRFARTSSRRVLASEFGITTFVNVDLSQRYNIAPSQPVEAIIRAG